MLGLPVAPRTLNPQIQSVSVLPPSFFVSTVYCVDQDGEVKSAISGSVAQEMPSQEHESVADDGETGSHPERVAIL